MEQMAVRMDFQMSKKKKPVARFAHFVFSSFASDSKLSSQ
jgi:hypothetical protein